MYIHSVKNIENTPEYAVLTNDLPGCYCVAILDGLYKGTAIRITDLKLTGAYLDYQVNYTIRYDGIELSDNKNEYLDSICANILLERISLGKLEDILE